jgi:hypothetical protein
MVMIDLAAESGGLASTVSASEPVPMATVRLLFLPFPPPKAIRAGPVRSVVSETATSMAMISVAVESQARQGPRKMGTDLFSEGYSVVVNTLRSVLQPLLVRPAP